MSVLPALPRAAEGTVGIVPYLMAGYPSETHSVAAALAFAGQGVAAIELGIPFSDPLADGPVIQAAGQAALEAGVDVRRVLAMAERIAGRVPIFLMTYVNPVLAYGPARFAADAAGAGVAGVILPDLPPEEAAGVADEMHGRGLATVFMVAPTSAPERVAAICAASSGFVYCVTLTGITGVRTELPPGVADYLAGVRAVTDLPIAAGFGISRPEQVRALRGSADLAAVGSAVVAAMAGGGDPTRLVGELVAACR